MSISREDRAYHVLKTCELAARGLVPDVDDADDPSMDLLKSSYDKLTSKIKYLLPRASAQWKPEFEKALDSSHSIRIEKLDAKRKEAKRAYVGQCMACGRPEKNCRYTLDMAGDIDSAAWLASPTSVRDEYQKFSDAYEAVYDDNFVDNNTKSGCLPDIDRGCFVLGETCLRKAKLRYMLQTLLLESCYTCERDIEDFSTTGHPLPVDHGQDIFTVDNNKCNAFVALQDQIELAIADEKRPTPDLHSDYDFWNIIDNCRLIVANGNVDSLDQIVQERSLQTLQRLKYANEQQDRDGRDNCSECSDLDDQSDRHSCHEINQVRKKRKRIRVVDTDSEEEEGNEQGRGLGGEQRHRVVDTDNNGDSNAADHVLSSVYDPSADPVHLPTNKIPRKEHPPSILGVVGRQRAEGTLPSRREALMQLMSLQIRLHREERERDSAVCTNAILTLQELLQRVEQLSHTV